jgi:hypothetical protein
MTLLGILESQEAGEKMMPFAVAMFIAVGVVYLILRNER